MHRLSLVVSFVGFVAAAAVGACFIESPQPSTFRFACEVDEDCGDPLQTCTDGLCQQACGDADAPDCPEGAPVCFNGHCSSVCPVAEDVCPDPQTCITFDEDPDDDELPESGICGVVCDDQDHPCVEGQVCIEGACLSTCTTDEECGQGETCVAPVCVPSGGGGG